MATKPDKTDDPARIVMVVKNTSKTIAFINNDEKPLAPGDSVDLTADRAFRLRSPETWGIEKANQKWEIKRAPADIFELVIAPGAGQNASGVTIAAVAGPDGKPLSFAQRIELAEEMEEKGLARRAQETAVWRENNRQFMRQA